MECRWDGALLRCANQLPPELLQVIQNGSNEQYLETISRTALDPRYTYTLFAHCEDIFAHVCATLRSHGSLASSLATLGRIIPVAPYLMPYAERLLSEESFDFSGLDDHELLLFLLGLLRIFSFDWRTFKKYVEPEEVAKLLENPSRPVVYLAIRILQVYLSGADHWFEQMVRKHLGEDTPESDISGQWDDKVIDYRFLTLWEEERVERLEKLVAKARLERDDSSNSPTRVLPASCFDPSMALIGGFLHPRSILASQLSSIIGQELVNTATVASNLSRIGQSLKTSRPVLLAGLAGSGKTTLIRHAAEKLGALNKLITLQLNEQSDAKLLIGVYTTGETADSFVWKPGVLTTAVQEGRWILIEDLDRAPNEIIGTLLPLIEKGQLFIPSRKENISAAPGFKIFATVRTTINHRGEEMQPLAHMIGIRHWQHVSITMPRNEEQGQIASQLYPSISRLLPQFMAVYEHLQEFQNRATMAGQSKTGVLRPVSLRDFLKWCNRVSELLRKRDSFTSSDVDDIFMEAVDCFVGALQDSPVRTGMAAAIAEELLINPQRRDYLLNQRDVRYELEKDRITVGRYNLPRTPQLRKSLPAQNSFSTNPHTSRMLEKVAAAVTNREPLLLVGETGVGKTTAVQHLAAHLGKKIVPFNLSQQSEAGDLLGGFKPINARSLIVPLKDEFDELFSASFSASKNQQFLDLLSKQMSRNNWNAVCKLWQQALKMVDQHRSDAHSRQGEGPSKKRKVENKKSLDVARWDLFASQVADLEHRLSSGSAGFAFKFVEGNIIKAVRNGDWVLLDEINLASPDTLEAIADLFDDANPSIMLTEAGNVERIEAHPEFRIFAAMNPATDVGKKNLPPGIRSRFTELYVESPDKDTKSLQSIVRAYLRHEAAADPVLPIDTSSIYQRIIALAEENKLVDGAGQRPHFSLRTLTRTLSFAKYIAPLCNLRRALYEGFQMNFLTFLDVESANQVQQLLEQHLFGKRTQLKAELQRALRKPGDGKQYVLGYPGSKHWLWQGEFDVEEQPHYILTPFIRKNLENLVRAASTRQFPVLIQGPTSSGKTSMIEYLAKRTGHKFVRINNHEHTDLQEYLGSYISDTDGRLQFQEGVLVKALREGHWIVLDELNLAPTDVLEALNRLLDDNRELLIPETQEVVRPHANFMLFATQNPAGLYGGRKALSRAFRSRFLELHFDDIPVEELQEILHRRTLLPESRCKRIVAVYRELSVLRQETRVFEQKSFATLRDLFRWALRPNDTIEQLAANGFMLLAERVRKAEEQQTLRSVIERVMSMNGPRVKIDETVLYSAHSKEIEHYRRSSADGGVVWTKSMRRLYVLVSRAIQNKEPVLLVGDTGCGKTTVCQIIADAFDKALHTVNVHQNTETGDLIGSQRPIRNRAAIEATLRHQLLSSPPLQSLETAATHPTDVLLDGYDQAIASLPAQERTAYTQTISHIEVQNARTRFKALFEWVDGALVQSMRSGDFFLLDEISLADDSVLERINSVLEPQRSILLAEKGSIDSYVAAAPEFQFFATMNPGGDYGKRELSPALRNRFTEIWVPPLDDSEDITQIVSDKLVSNPKSYPTGMVAFAQWFQHRYNTSASSSISIRDVLAWVTFLNAFAAHNWTGQALVHGAAMVYIDTLGANPSGLMSMSQSDVDAERRACVQELGRHLGVDATAIYCSHVQVEVLDDKLTAGPFAVQRNFASKTVDLVFSFDPPTTRINAMRVIRALQLPKPILLEGSPGVGKTALVTAIAQAVGIPLTRVNLSEQTDLLDLFGSDAPVEGEQAGNFVWRDAPFLRAMKNGEWVLLDEMNLASQSVLEGLNACLDHRGEVFVPELGQSFVRHPNFRLFAAQNPHHQGGGRKGLPASFVNRFTVVYADSFRPEDLTLICRQSFPSVDIEDLAKIIDFVEDIDHSVNLSGRPGTTGGPWEFNLRDISRWLGLSSSDSGFVRSGTHRDFVDFLFTQRFRSASDRALVQELFSRRFGSGLVSSDLFPSMSSHILQLGLGSLPRDQTSGSPWNLTSQMAVIGACSQILQSLMLSIQQRWPTILAGPSGSGKTAMIERLASVVGATVMTIALNAETDAMDLVGGYEQADPQRETRSNMALSQRQLRSKALAELTQVYNPSISSDLNQLSPSDSKIASKPNAVQTAQGEGKSIHKARFEWLDGLLVEALQEGNWLVLDNANLCSPSVLDRLNSLLEPNGSLIINEHSTEDGAARVIRPHPNFHVFLTLDPRHGELSRAMRNRAVELYILPDQDANSSSCMEVLRPESALSRFGSAKALSDLEYSEQLRGIARDHIALSDQPLLSRFENQLDQGLYGKRQIEPPDAISFPHQSDGQGFDGNSSLIKLYHSNLSQLQVPADFALVQTFHPLNNQALVHFSPQALLEACSVAFKHGLAQKLAMIQQFLASTTSDTITKMRRLERSLKALDLSNRVKGNRSVMFDSLKRMVDALSALLEAGLTSDMVHASQVENSVGKLCVFCISFLEALKRDQLTSAELIAWMSVGQDLARLVASGTPSYESNTVVRIRRAFEAFYLESGDVRGTACVVLWSTLKPSAPATLEQLEGLLSIEEVVDHFDAICFRFEQPLDSMLATRASCARVLSVAMEASDDLPVLLSTVHNLSSLQSNDVSRGDNWEPPHFCSTFRQVHERFATLALEDPKLVPSQSAAMEVLALVKTKESIQTRTAPKDKSILNNFHLLGSIVTNLIQTTAGQSTDHRSNPTILQQLITTNHVSLARLDLLRSETKTLGGIASSNAHLLAGDVLKPLDACLNRLVSDAIQTLSDVKVATYLQRLCTTLSLLLEERPDSPTIKNAATVMKDTMTGSDASTMLLSTKLLTAVTYLRSTYVDADEKLSYAAQAWAAFASACLVLYIPKIPFDPVLGPQLRLDLHRRLHGELTSSIQCLRHFREHLFGEANNIRAELLEEKIDSLGQEPNFGRIYRPKVSQRSELQSDLDNLLHILQPLWQAQDCATFPLPFERSLLANVVQVRHRLKTNYRAYDDFTSPIVGFIDCLLTAQRLAMLTSSVSRQESPLADLLPFVGATLDTWSTDDLFLSRCASLSSQSEQLCWLSSIAFRTNVHSSLRPTSELSNLIESQFMGFYSYWKKTLQAEQAKYVTKSSVYKFRGGDQEQNEPSAEELEEMFPSAINSNPAEDSITSRQRAQDLVHSIAALHYSIFSQERADSKAIVRLMQTWAALTQDDSLQDGKLGTIPTVILMLGDLESTLSGSPHGQASFDIYRDSNVGEAQKLNELMRKITRRFEELHLAWPEHAVPLEVLRLISELTKMSHSTPLSRFLPLVEKIHVTANEWQTIASREYSVNELLEGLISLIVHWRRLELSTWAGLLDHEWHQAQRDATSWWYVAYESIIVATSQLEEYGTQVEDHVLSLVETLGTFLTSAGLGEFNARLRILRGFENHIASWSTDSQSFGDVHQALTNVVNYYNYFEEPVSEALSKGRAMLETNLKEVIQLASWKDRKIDMLRQSAQSSHKKLLRLVRKYRALLAQPMASIFQAGMPSRKWAPALLLSHVTHRHQYKTIDQAELRDLVVWQERPDRFRDVATTSRLMQTKLQPAHDDLDGSQQLVSFESWVRQSIAELQKATPSSLTEDNKALIKHLKTRKRRLLADVLKSVQSMGFQTSISGQVLSQQSSSAAVFTRLPPLTRASVIDAEGVQYNFFRLLEAMPSVRECARNHSEEVTAAEIGRCISLLESIFQKAIQQHDQFTSHIMGADKLKITINQVINFGQCDRVKVRTNEANPTETAQIYVLGDVLSTCIEVLEVQQRLSGNNYLLVIEGLRVRAEQLSQLQRQHEALPPLPPNVFDEKYEEFRSSFSTILIEIQSTSQHAISTYPEIEPVISQMLRWTDEQSVQKELGSQNGNLESASVWTRELLALMDDVLAAIQDAERILQVTQKDEGKAKWLLRQQTSLERLMTSLRTHEICQMIDGLLSRLQYLEPSDLPSVAAVCAVLSPICETYRTEVEKLLKLSGELYVKLCSTGYCLAQSFLQLAKNGFCSPSEKATGDAQNEGDIENGTGLGDGEGAEDISKDVGGDEDLSELAQEGNKKDSNEDLEDEKDAVDMADEELNGDLDDGSAETDQDDNGEQHDDEEKEGIEEETGEIGNSEPSAVDEKMWDAAQGEEKQEKEAESGKGTSARDDLGAGEERDSDGDLEDGDMGPENEEITASTEVEQQPQDKVDSSAPDEENLELPDDMAMDANKSAESDASDVESSDDESMNGDTAQEAMHMSDHDHDEDDNSKKAEDIAMGAEEAAEEPENATEEDTSNMLMRDQQDLDTDDAADNGAFADTGSGAENNSADQSIDAKPDAQNPTEYDPEDKSQRNESAGAQSGQQEGNETSRKQGIDGEDQETLPFKQLGDILQQWYDQHKDIQEAKNETKPERQQDVDMAQAQFEHVASENDPAETQALGASATEQSTALNTDKALSVNDEEHEDQPMANDFSDQEDDAEDVQAQEPGTLTDSTDDRRQAQQPSTLIGPQPKKDIDMDKNDGLSVTESDEVEDVDEKLTNTHISHEEVDEQLSQASARVLWKKHEDSTRNLALVLTEQLRLILHPTQATKMRGDFRTGKRLNIKRIIPYIASSYKRDKIWMRRSVPSKRSYQVMLAIDDSKSMTESQSSDLAFETLALVAKSMSMLDVGELSVVSFGEDVKTAHDFKTPFTSDAGVDIFRHFTFSNNKTDVRKLLAESIELFRAARMKASGSASDLWQLQLIISDGICEDHPSIRQLVRQAHEERIMIVFIVVDSIANQASSKAGSKQSILDLQTAEFVKNGNAEPQLKMVKYLDTFPFRYYLIVRDVQELPAVLSGALRQWFAEVMDTSG